MCQEWHESLKSNARHGSSLLHSHPNGTPALLLHFQLLAHRSCAVIGAAGSCETRLQEAAVSQPRTPRRHNSAFCTSDDKFHGATASAHDPNLLLTVGGVAALLRSHHAEHAGPASAIFAFQLLLFA